MHIVHACALAKWHRGCFSCKRLGVRVLFCTRTTCEHNVRAQRASTTCEHNVRAQQRTSVCIFFIQIKQAVNRTQCPCMCCECPVPFEHTGTPWGGGWWLELDVLAVGLISASALSVWGFWRVCGPINCFARKQNRSSIIGK